MLEPELGGVQGQPRRAAEVRHVVAVRLPTVHLLAADGVPGLAEVNASGPQKPKLYVKGNDVLLEIGDGNLERLSIKGKTLLVEHFNPKALYLAGPPNAKGTGTLVTAHKE